MTSPRKKRGRPPRPMPEPIPDTPERIAWAIMQTPPKAEWDYVAISDPFLERQKTGHLLMGGNDLRWFGSEG